MLPRLRKQHPSTNELLLWYMFALLMCCLLLSSIDLFFVYLYNSVYFRKARYLPFQCACVHSIGINIPFPSPVAVRLRSVNLLLDRVFFVLLRVGRSAGTAVELTCW